jgi:hypothetical protein
MKFQPPDGVQWYQHRMTGDAGYRHRDEEMIHYHRGQDAMQVRFAPADWIEQKEPRLLTEMMVADIAFHADRRLCYCLGDYAKARREWINLREEEKISFMQKGPHAVDRNLEARKKLYDHIQSALEEYLS